jgi:hypothetical protein
MPLFLLRNATALSKTDEINFDRVHGDSILAPEQKIIGREKTKISKR